ncbi:AAA family ATPase [Bifidobacterium thermophilum]|uniref:AAA family ATPase n=1 Tax=Bifidobacterium thermophilum TaxID=33905 RepID=UPI003094E533
MCSIHVRKPICRFVGSRGAGRRRNCNVFGPCILAPSPERTPQTARPARRTPDRKDACAEKLANKRYDDLAFVDFSQTPQAASAFEDSIRPSDIVRRLELLLGISIVPRHTLIAFDEVQLCERALTSLKYFCDEAPEYHVAVAGNLLGVAVNRNKCSFPVGKVTLLPVHS